MDGDWQIGHKTAVEYGRTAAEAAKVMKWTDNSIETVLCGSASRDMPTFGDWEATTLDLAYDKVDYLSLHIYFDNRTNDTPSFLAKSMKMDEFISSVVCICDYIKAKKRSKHTVNLSFDEWNVWYHSNGVHVDKWSTAPHQLEDIYNFEDALLVGLMLITFLRNADRVKIACMAQLVNVIAPIMSRKGGGAWAQATYYPMMQASTFGRGISLKTKVVCDTMDTPHYKDVPVVEAAAVLHDDDGITIFAVNRDLKDDAELNIDLRAFGDYKTIEQTVMHHDDMNAVNTEENPDNVKPGMPKELGSGEKIVLPAASWNVIRLLK
jgi:alpha-N-arabinofuranosidase